MIKLELVKERFVSCESDGLVQSAGRGVVDACQKSKATKTVLGGQFDASLQECPSDSATTIGVEHVQFIEVQVSLAGVKFWDTYQNGDACRVRSHEGEYQPDRIRVKDIVPSQALTQAGWGSLRSSGNIRVIFGFDALKERR